jgi:hypothetical protein
MPLAELKRNFIILLCFVMLLLTNLIFHQKIMKTGKLDIIEVGSGEMGGNKRLYGKKAAQIKWRKLLHKLKLIIFHVPCLLWRC